MPNEKERIPAEQDADKSGLTPADLGINTIPICEQNGGLVKRFLKWNPEENRWNEVVKNA